MEGCLSQFGGSAIMFHATLGWHAMWSQKCEVKHGSAWFCYVLLRVTCFVHLQSMQEPAIGHCPQTLNSTRTLAKDIVTVAKKSLHWKHPLTGRYLRALNWLKKVRSTELPHFTELLLRCIKCSKHGSTLGTLLKGIVDPKKIWDKATCGFNIALIYSFFLKKEWKKHESILSGRAEQCHISCRTETLCSAVNSFCRA